ncbi:hypothetical protein BJ166DRAFT_4421 [Pestalotiopsis sp. NC0098]|nr:hypothetical protein BJ166DRAFT_4421 [Pestalotiopsis sp. NC0098]
MAASRRDCFDIEEPKLFGRLLMAASLTFPAEYLVWASIVITYSSHDFVFYFWDHALGIAAFWGTAAVISAVSSVIRPLYTTSIVVIGRENTSKAENAARRDQAAPYRWRDKRLAQVDR